MFQKYAQIFLFIALICGPLLPAQVEAQGVHRNSVHVVRPTAPSLSSVKTDAHQATPINFNGLIDQTGKRKHRLAKRVATKTAGREFMKRRRARPSETKVSGIDFEDMHMQLRAAPKPKRKVDSVTSARPAGAPVSAPVSAPMSVVLVPSPSKLTEKPYVLIGPVLRKKR